MKKSAIRTVSRQSFFTADQVQDALRICGDSSTPSITGPSSLISAPAEEVHRLQCWKEIRHGILSKISKSFGSILALKNGWSSAAHGDLRYRSVIPKNIRRV